MSESWTIDISELELEVLAASTNISDSESIPTSLLEDLEISHTNSPVSLAPLEMRTTNPWSQSPEDSLEEPTITLDTQDHDEERVDSDVEEAAPDVTPDTQANREAMTSEAEDTGDVGGTTSQSDPPSVPELTSGVAVDFQAIRATVLNSFQTAIRAKVTLWRCLILLFMTLGWTNVSLQTKFRGILLIICIRGIGYL